MFFRTLGVIALCFMSGDSSDVNNFVRGKILFSNQNTNENNEEFIHTSGELIMSRDEIYEFLSSEVPSDVMTKERIKDLLSYLSDAELRHIDFLIYLIDYYRFAGEYILKVILEILLEDQRNYENLLRNIGLNASALPPMNQLTK